jgi:putative peptidoglycan lipid II flippase
VLALASAYALGMSVIGLLLVLAVRRHAGGAALAGLGRATAAGIVAAGVAALAGWGVVIATGDRFGHPVPRALVQGLLAGVVVLIAYAGTAGLLDRPDMRRLKQIASRRRRA